MYLIGRNPKFSKYQQRKSHGPRILIGPRSCTGRRVGVLAVPTGRPILLSSNDRSHLSRLLQPTSTRIELNPSFANEVAILRLLLSASTRTGVTDTTVFIRLDSGSLRFILFPCSKCVSVIEDSSGSPNCLIKPISSPESVTICVAYMKHVCARDDPILYQEPRRLQSLPQCKCSPRRFEPVTKQTADQFLVAGIRSSLQCIAVVASCRSKEFLIPQFKVQYTPDERDLIVCQTRFH